MIQADMDAHQTRVTPESVIGAANRLVWVRQPAQTLPRGPARTISADQLARTRDRGYRRRKATNALMLGCAVACAIIALIPLFAIAAYVVVKGASSLSLNFFVHAEIDHYTDAFGIPHPVGIGNTILGTLLLVAIACLIGLPIGLCSGIYLAEYGRGRFATAVRFLADVMAGIPSIVAGLIGYTLVVRFIGFSAVAGGFALGLLMFPIVARATEEVLRLVPVSLREGGLALGLPRWKVIARIVVPTAAGGIVTSMLLGVARVAGETAPLLFTAADSQYWVWNPLKPVGALSYTIYNFATNPPSPHEATLAYAGALVLVAIVVLLNVLARLLVRRQARGRI